MNINVNTSTDHSLVNYLQSSVSTLVQLIPPQISLFFISTLNFSLPLKSSTLLTSSSTVSWSVHNSTSNHLQVLYLVPFSSLTKPSPYLFEESFQIHLLNLELNISFTQSILSYFMQIPKSSSSLRPSHETNKRKKKIKLLRFAAEAAADVLPKLRQSLLWPL